MLFGSEGQRISSPSSPLELPSLTFRQSPVSTREVAAQTRLISCVSAGSTRGGVLTRLPMWACSQLLSWDSFAT